MKAYGYIRVSGKSQVEGDGPERQGSAIESFCKAHGLGLIFTFGELAVSGTVEGMDRPQFFKLMQEIESVQGEKPCIVVERLDRLARELMVQEIILRECRERGVQVFSVDQGQLVDIASNDGDPTRKLMRQIMGALAEWEKSALVMKLAKARARKRAETGRCEGPLPYGKKDKSEADVLLFITQRRNMGYTWPEISTALNTLGAKTRTGLEWTARLARMSAHGKEVA